MNIEPTISQAVQHLSSEHKSPASVALRWAFRMTFEVQNQEALEVDGQLICDPATNDFAYRSKEGIEYYAKWVKRENIERTAYLASVKVVVQTARAVMVVDEFQQPKFQQPQPA